MAEVQTTPSDPIPKDQPPAHHDSEAEYESAEEVYEEEEEVEVEEEVEEEEEDLVAPGERDLDDDEDRKNPQFIPKKGYFYEHDDRTQADEETAEVEPEEPAKEQQKVKKTGGADKWTHDLYDDGEQAGKSKEEIIETYGYDIRADDQPPKAVRRRRYGRDPRKYTRKSDEVDGNRRGRGGGYRGGSRGRRGGGPPRREGQEEAYEENFPSLIKPLEKVDSFEGGRGGQESNRGRSSEGRGNIRGGRGGGKPPPPPPRTNQQQRASYHDDRDEGGYRERNSYSDRGSRGGGGGPGRGRRNEFTNRNRYRDRREPMNEPGPPGPGRSTGGAGRNDRDYGEPRFERRSEHQQQQQHHHHQHDDRRVANGSSGDKPRNEGSRPAKPVLAPFTNTEYTGSASLTAIPGPNSVKGGPGGGGGTDLHRSLNGNEVDLKKSNDPKGEPARRPQSKGAFQNERRSQIPPRMMPQLQQDATASPPNAAAAAGKPKKFSTQRQRQVIDPPGQQQQQQQSSSASQMIPQVVPVSTPVVTGAGPMVPSPVPNYTPQQPYFEPAPGNFEAQVYETAGSPMTGNGPSVSPSLWGPHAAAFATAPYPSPPTGPSQVPVQQQAYGDPAAAYIAAPPQPGPTIYAAPPQFIQDPTLLNFAPGPGPQFGAPFHPQGFQGYAQVTPGPPPEVYHAGVTYYNTHNQMQRPPVVAVQKRPKTVLQLVEPPEKVKGVVGKDPQQQQQLARASDPDSQTPIIDNELEQAQQPVEEQGNLEKPAASSPDDVELELVSKFSNMATPTGGQTKEDNIVTEELQVSTSPQQPSSWAAEVDQMSPVEQSPSMIGDPPEESIQETKLAEVEKNNLKSEMMTVVEESEPPKVVVEVEKKEQIIESTSSSSSGREEGGDSSVERKVEEAVKEELLSNATESSA